jgi:hypothetical protein
MSGELLTRLSETRQDKWALLWSAQIVALKLVLLGRVALHAHPRHSVGQFFAAFSSKNTAYLWV